MSSPDPNFSESSQPPAADLHGQVAALQLHVAQLEEENQGLRSQTATSPLSPSLVTHAPIIIFAFDRNGVITVSEGNALPSTGRTEREILGRSFFDVYADIPQVVACAHRALTGDACTAQVTLGSGVFEIYYTPVRQP